MRTFNRILVITLATFTGLSAHAAGFGLLGGANFYNTSDSGASTKAALTGGVAVMGYISPRLGLEADALYTQNKNDFSSYNSLQIPVLLRFRLTHRLGLGLGGYYALNLNEGNGIKSSDSGALASLRFSVPTGRPHLIFEGRYLYGVTNLSESGDAKARSFQILVGIMVGM